MCECNVIININFIYEQDIKEVEDLASNLYDLFNCDKPKNDLKEYIIIKQNEEDQQSEENKTNFIIKLKKNYKYKNYNYAKIKQNFINFFRNDKLLSDIYYINIDFYNNENKYINPTV